MNEWRKGESCRSLVLRQGVTVCLAAGCFGPRRGYDGYDALWSIHALLASCDMVGWKWDDR